MKKVSVVFGLGVAGVAVSFIMTLIVGFQEYHQRQENAAHVSEMPVPAIAPN